ncbi:hypothetical protein SAMN05444004_11940 [Jannaschia faecimaris]|uniref:Uncharacterized protein n=1 Tax=Jannaschia faecimaris TaxID=1244108 RepID=A0A1H3TSM6_9RHOB|nr:hypothetical protein [Jannaschia faecimaris]SDZ52821.1 hypothetical protein SAMN05444004_11940 [Jannaschia faecimaris]
MRQEAWSWDRRGWHFADDGATYAVARRLPVQWDISAQTRLPDMGRRRLAHAVRQDLWRILQRLRGFAPVVTVTRDGQGLSLRAGGSVAGRIPRNAQEQVAALLNDPVKRAAWARTARHR